MAIRAQVEMESRSLSMSFQSPVDLSLAHRIVGCVPGSVEQALSAQVRSQKRTGPVSELNLDNLTRDKDMATIDCHIDDSGAWTGGFCTGYEWP